MKISKNPPIYNNFYKLQKGYSYYNNPSFKGKPKSNIFKPINDKLNNFIDEMAEFFVKSLEKEPIKRLVQKLQKSKNLVSHLTALTSLVLSGFYVQQTLKNDKLDSEKRKTLAINQIATCLLSTALAYFIDKSVNSKINEVTNKYIAVNIKNSPMLQKFKAGISAAKSIIIFGTIYRFISPVLVTPLANYLGNKLNEKKEPELAGKVNKKQ